MDALALNNKRKTHFFFTMPLILIIRYPCCQESVIKDYLIVKHKDQKSELRENCLICKNNNKIK